MVGSDGLFDCVHEDLIADFVGRQLDAGQSVEGAAQALLQLALDSAAFKTQMTPEELASIPPGDKRRSLIDDVTIVILIL